MSQFSGIRKKYAYFVHDYIKIPIQKKLGLKIFPTSINFLATGFCNSRCVMCSVWKFPDRRKFELTPQEIGNVVADPLFKRVRDIGISGGEPFLRKDIPEVCESLIDNLPRLRTLTISTHGFHTHRVKRFAARIAQICEQSGIRFRLSVSLDGIGQLHDQVRGIAGAFNRTWQIIQWIRDETNIDLVVGITLLQINFEYASEILSFCKRENLKCDFRIATAINRLGNQASIHEVQVSDSDTRVLAEFFQNLANDDYFSLERRFFYASTREKLSDHSNGFCHCRAQDESCYLDAEGYLFHCAVYGKTIGNGTQLSSRAVYFSEFAEEIRQKMYLEACDGCVHDYRTRVPLANVAEWAVHQVKIPKYWDVLCSVPALLKTWILPK